MKGKGYTQVDGATARLLTALIDYARFYFVVWLSITWATTDDGELVPPRISICILSILASHIVTELLYASILGPDSLSSYKRSGVFKDVRSRRIMSSFAMSAAQLSLIGGLGSYYEVFRSVQVDENEDGRGGTVWAWVAALALPYTEFCMISVIKDLTSMHIFHRMMHDRKNKFFYSMHSTHHEFREDLNIVNAAQIDGLDLFIENGIGPFLLVATKVALGFPAQVSLVSFLYIVSSEGSTHSCNPYSVCYYNPLLDAVLKATISHNLHHARPHLNPYVIPWHHIWRGYRDDLQLYNRVLKTNVKM